jgi:alkylation response protein AidB-like acyl-CoA dehydrogenase
MLDKVNEVNKDRLWEANLLAEATRISEILASHAADHDRDASFPSEGIDAVLSSPIHTALLDGATWTTFCLIVGILAKGDPSAATAWLMHQGSAMAFSTLPDPAAVSFFEGEWRRGAWFGNALSEPTSGNLFLMPQQVARPVDGGFRLSGKKRFVTNCERSKYLLTNALCNGEPAFFIIDKDDSIVIEDIWDAMGMRGTRSQLLSMNDTFLPDARRVRAGDKPNPIPVGLAWLSIGVAEAAMEFAIAYAKERRLPPKDLPLSQMQWVQFAVADMAIQLEAARALGLRAAAATDENDPAAGLLQMKAKAAANEMACEVATAALRISGGSGYLKRLPIERYLRDAMSGPIMAWSTEVIRDFLGKMLLGVGPGDG